MKLSNTKQNKDYNTFADETWIDAKEVTNGFDRFRCFVCEKEIDIKQLVQMPEGLMIKLAPHYCIKS